MVWKVTMCIVFVTLLLIAPANAEVCKEHDVMDFSQNGVPQTHNLISIHKPQHPKQTTFLPSIFKEHHDFSLNQK